MAFSLDDSFNKLTWMIVFMDLSNILTDGLLTYLREWNQRYARHEFGVLLICKTQYGFQRDRQTVEKLLEAKKIEFPLVIDFDDGLFGAFSVKNVPMVAVFSAGKILATATDLRELPKIETDLQNHLRTKDFGLPLPRPFQTNLHGQNRFYKIDFARCRGVDFFHPDNVEKSLSEEYAQELLKGKPEQSAIVQGKFRQDNEGLFTDDLNAKLRIYAHGGNVFLLARSLGKVQEATKVYFDASGRQIPEMFAGEHVKTDDAGNAFIEVGGPHLYQLIKNAPEEFRFLTFKFPNSGRIPVTFLNFQIFE